MTDLAAHASRLLGRGAIGSTPLHGGDLSEIRMVTLEGGTRVVAKSGETAKTEADMLAAIRAADVPAPNVLACDETLLVLELLPDDGSLSDTWADLGEKIRKLHATLGSAYGWEKDYRFHTVSIPNMYTESWPQFWAERRLLPSLPHVASSFVPRIEKLAARLGDILPTTPPPSLLHGDLWSGNILSYRGKTSGLIDPACYYGHGEVDLAMLHLFASPGPEFQAGYGELEAGWEARLPIYQLWPALVHLRLFGSGYSGMVDRMLRAAGV